MMDSQIFSAMKDHLIRVNSVASSSVEESNDMIELRSRGRPQGYTNVQRSDDSSPTWLGSRVIIDRKIEPGDTLNKIALQYSVPVSFGWTCFFSICINSYFQVPDLKRANNIVNDQEIHALPIVKIPVSRFFADRLEAEMNANVQVEAFRHHHASKSAAPASSDDRRPLLEEDDEDSDELNRRAKVGALLERTDANVAQVRGNLPSPGLEGGAFHFVDATSPDTTMRSEFFFQFQKYWLMTSLF